MNKLLTAAVAAAAGFAIAGEAAATEWNVSVWGKRRAFTEHVEKLAELVSEKTDGAFTMNVSYGGLSKPRENLDGISIGAFEMAQFCAGYHRDKNPSITVLELPFLGVNNLAEEVAVSHAVYAHPAAAKDLARWNAKLLMTSPMPQYNLVGTGEPRDELAEFDGMRVRATGGLGKAFEAVGGVPTSVPATEAYNAMESGVVDTVAFAQHAHLSFGTINKADWWTANLNPGTVNCPVVVNTDAYDMLSDAEREALDSSVDEAIAHYLDNYGKLLTKWDSVLEEKGVEKVMISEEQLAAFRAKAADPIREQWIKDMTAQGIPGQELYDLVMKTLEDTRAGN
ncbi:MULTISPECIES: C4-dicarboxylate TRAP transporter substrate-binding protein [Rhodobacterales]|jgi:TRAP-type C4-dicarboxylate transport system substrate-binding protein|uniref:C4-dicarboxylate ABC transporter substrate-binding protein n=1 Tax=Phaeobacter gallaeciensis TaxID=60890 RepID=A0A1B0ZMP4_9RHOB|nr:MULTISPECIES: C4-dicarboxylate TRAP transporter substrate-binding protein [Phaeobacter]MDF1771197.1 C4-dicarboxylate TRAP transporter substrate-binding protein [Pseudophaeobacter sp. bin_em_oilr2.035]MEE2634280.1 C4-dicarboxylate TRAP transporter substrate-binding protein [Pseudomonadota bacterium]ANP35381.1 C4-dicarboxylate ABC transporter substrate-binding protein [Phaeobacter gallaeciensis]MDE4062072.1 C4-dicarboxylate TRAP transporter substrate-binding protein [Phaeobacter gallaeciensis]